MKKNKSTTDKENKWFTNAILGILILYLITDFIPHFGRGDIAVPQFLFLNLVNIFTSIFILTFRKHFLFSVNQFFKNNHLLTIYLIFLVLSGLSGFFANNHTLSIVSFSQLFVVFMMVINLSLLLFNRLQLIYTFAFLVGLSALIQSLKILLNLDSFFDAEAILALMKSSAVKGNTGNINIFSASLLLKIPFAFIVIIKYKNWKRWLMMLAIFMSTIIVFLINARASLISLLLITITVIAYHNTKKKFSKAPSFKISFLVLPIILSFFFTEFVVKNDDFKGRRGSSIERIQEINVTSDKNARIRFWKNAIEMTKANPITGVGIGNWIVESLPYEPPSKKISLYAHNDFFEIFAETGVLNGIVYLSLFILAFILNIRRVLKPVSELSEIVALLALLVLVVYGVDAFFNFPLYRPSMQLGFAFFMALTLINLPKTELETYTTKKITLILLALSTLPLYASYQADKTLLLEMTIRKDPGIDNITVMTKVKGSDIVNFSPKLPNILLSTGAAFDEYAGVFYYKEKKYDSSILYFEKAKTINPYLGKADYYMHLIAKERNQKDSAYKHLKASFYTRPRDFEVYRMVILEAAIRKDSTEILSIYNHYNSIHKNPKAINEALLTLQVSGYNLEKVERFLNAEYEKLKDEKNANTIFSKSYTELGKKFQSFGNRKKTLINYEKAIMLDSTNHETLTSIGLLYVNERKFEKAIEFLKKASEHPESKDGKPEYAIGLNYIVLGDNQNACKYLYLAKVKNNPAADLQIKNHCK